MWPAGFPISTARETSACLPPPILLLHVAQPAPTGIGGVLPLPFPSLSPLGFFGFTDGQTDRLTAIRYTLSLSLGLVAWVRCLSVLGVTRSAAASLLNRGCQSGFWLPASLLHSFDIALYRYPRPTVAVKFAARFGPTDRPTDREKHAPSLLLPTKVPKTTRRNTAISQPSPSPPPTKPTTTTLTYRIKPIPIVKPTHQTKNSAPK